MKTLDEIKNYYKNYDNGWEIRAVNQRLATEIVNECKWNNLRFIFEFGCGNGKNLRLLSKLYRTLELFGCDLNPNAVRNANEIGIDGVNQGDEISLNVIPTNAFDIVFTCSVLDHLPKKTVEKVIENLKRIAGYAVILMETNDEIDEYYVSHDYSKFDFKYEVSIPSSGDGGVYKLWKWKKKI